MSTWADLWKSLVRCLPWRPPADAEPGEDADDKGTGSSGVSVLPQQSAIGHVPSSQTIANNTVLHGQYTPSSPVVLDHVSDPSELRWVGTEFVYFIDIPWLPHPDGSPYPHALSGDMVLNILQDFMETGLDIDVLLTPVSPHSTILSGRTLTRLIVPWARRTLQHTTRAASFGARFRQRIDTFATAIDSALLLQGSTLLRPGPHQDRLRAVGTLVLALARCACAWGVRAPLEVLDSTRMLQEIITLYRAALARRWSADSAWEIERILGAGIPFVAFATASAPTANRTKHVSADVYAPVHVDERCTCGFVGPAVAEVQQLLAQHRVPVVVVEGDGVLVRDSAETPYVAISHVWADGLGSTTEAGLPHCQVRRLAGLARLLHPSGAFWIDALCVPRDKDSRRRAIGLMAKTYERAEKVLVTDGGVRTQCSLSSPKEECLLRIATSGWMQRVWTLQEGMLAREIYFELSDGLIDCTHFDGAPYRIAQEVVPLLQHRPRDDRKMAYEAVLLHPPRCTFNEIIPLLRHRTTSKPEDEAVAISGLLSIDAGELAAIASAGGRMKTLLMRCGALPRCIAVYGWHSRKLSLPNFTWAPASVSEVFWYGDPLDPLWATATEEGLRGRYTVIRFPPLDMSNVYGLVATVTTNEQHPLYESGRAYFDIVPSFGAREQRVTAGARVDISPLFVDMRRESGMPLVVNALLMTRPGLPPTEREEPVAAVYIPSLLEGGGDARGLEEAAPMRCQFVGAARLQIDPPSVKRNASTPHWHRVDAEMDSLVYVCLS